MIHVLGVMVMIGLLLIMNSQWKSNESWSRQFSYLCLMKTVKVYKPTDEEILRNTLHSFEIENIRISLGVAKGIFEKVLIRIKKANG